MKKDFDMFVEKAAEIISKAPPYANKSDKIAMLNRNFRLNKKESELLLKKIKSL